MSVEGNPGTAPVQRDLVVIGASAGGVEALQTLVSGLPPEFPAAVLVVLHVPSTGTSVLPQILARRGPLPVAFARDGDELVRGQIYVAPADHHMLVHDSHISVSQGPRENGHRPAIDPLFRSAARVAAVRCVGVVLSGLLDDGATGLRFLKERGGAAVVQDPRDAAFPSMPEAALALTDVDRIVPVADIAKVLSELVDAPIDFAAAVAGQAPADDAESIDGHDRVELGDPRETARLLGGAPTALTCPECGGVLWEAGDERYACHVGHAYTLASLAEEQGRDLEATLWSAIRSLEERADVARRLARRTRGSRVEAYEQRAQDAEQSARALRELISSAGRLGLPQPLAGEGS